MSLNILLLTRINAYNTLVRNMFMQPFANIIRFSCNFNINFLEEYLYDFREMKLSYFNDDH